MEIRHAAQVLRDIFDPMAAVVYDFADGRSGKHAQAFLNSLVGKVGVR